MSNKDVIDSGGTPVKQNLYAVFNSEDEAMKAEQALAAKGVTAQRLAGSSDAHDLARKPQEDSLLGKATRFVKGFGGEDLEAKRYSVHTDNGRIVLVVPCEDQDTAHDLTKLLEGYGAYDATFFSDWTIEHTSPEANADRGIPTFESSTNADEYDRGELQTRPSQV